MSWDCGLYGEKRQLIADSLETAKGSLCFGGFLVSYFPTLKLTSASVVFPA